MHVRFRKSVFMETVEHVAYSMKPENVIIEFVYGKRSRTKYEVKSVYLDLISIIQRSTGTAFTGKLHSHRVREKKKLNKYQNNPILYIKCPCPFTISDHLNRYILELCIDSDFVEFEFDYVSKIEIAFMIY